MFCCSLLYVYSSIAIILMRKRELIALLGLSSWCLVVVGRLFLAVPRGCLQFVIVVFPDHTHLLFLPTVIGLTTKHAVCCNVNVIANRFIMGNNMKELSLKISRANNLLQLIHQVTIEIRFQNSWAQEKFKSNLEFRYQIIVSFIKLREGFAKFMIPIALFKKFLN